MESKFFKDIKVSYTNINTEAKMGIITASEILQDSVTEFFNTIGSDNFIVKRDSNAIWVICKMKIHVFNFPTWLDDVKVETYIVNQTRIKLDIEFKITDKKGNLLFIGTQEVCPIDLDTRKIRKLDTICYPQDIKKYEPSIDKKYEVINLNLEDAKKVGCETVPWIDIDFSNHTNNISYIKYIMKTFDGEFLDTHEIEDFEIHFLNESKYNDNLDVYKVLNNNNYDFLIKKEDKDVIKARIKFKN